MENVKEGASYYRCIFAKVITMGKRQILAGPTGVQKEKCG